MKAAIYSALIATVCGGTAQAEDPATGRLVFGIAQSSRYGTLADIAFEAENLGNADIDVYAQARAGQEGAGASVRVGKTWHLGESFFGQDTRFRLGLDGLMADWDDDRYAIEQIGVRATLSAQLGPNGRYFTEGFWRQDHLSDFDPGVSTALSMDAGTSEIAGLSFGARWDDRADNRILTAGSLVSGRISLSGLGSTRDVAAASFTAQTTFALTGPAVMRLRAGAGHASATGSSARLHVLDRAFTADGLPRGFAYGGAGPIDPATGDVLGGATYASASAEALMPVGNRGVSVGLFYDMGAVSELPAISVTGLDDSFELRSSIGLSFNWDTNNGTLRASLAEPIDKQPLDDTQVFSVSFTARF